MSSPRLQSQIARLLRRQAYTQAIELVAGLDDAALWRWMLNGSRVSPGGEILLGGPFGSARRRQTTPSSARQAAWLQALLTAPPELRGPLPTALILRPPFEPLASLLPRLPLEHLTLRGHALEQVPDWVGALKELRTLTLAGCRIHTLPPALADLPLLETLELQGTRLRDLPTDLALPALRRLHLEGTPLRSVPVPPPWPGLTHLSLGGQRGLPGPEGLRELLAGLEQLEQVVAEDLDLIALPIGWKPRALERLQLAGNRLQRIPATLGDCHQLAHLDLGTNRLDRIPAGLGRLTRLRYLDLRENQLRALPPHLARLGALEELQLGTNPLETLPPLAGLGSLQILNASQCPLTELPEDIAQLSSLRVLQLSGTRLSVLPPGLFELPALEELQLRGAPVAATPGLEERLRARWPELRLLL